MGQPKLLLPFRDSTVLEHVVSAVRAGGVSTVVVVVPPSRDDLIALAMQAKADVCRLETETPDMRASCQAGIRWIEAQYRPSGEDGLLLLPADHPTLDFHVVRAVLEEATRSPRWSIFVPTWNGRRGHPTCFRWEHAAKILQVPEGKGLNAYIRERGEQTCEVPCSSEAILWDLDTPADYERLLDGEKRKGGEPSSPPCMP